MLMAILVPVVLAMAAYVAILLRAVVQRKAVPTLEAIGLGAVVNFFDTLGIGSFATTTAWLRFRKLVPDRLIPPTLIAGLTPPAMTEGIIFLILLGVSVDPTLLFGGALATGLGGLMGAPLVARARVWIVQATVAVGLLLAAIAFAMTNLHLFPGGGTATGLGCSVPSASARAPVSERSAGSSTATGGGAVASRRASAASTIVLSVVG